MGERCISTKDNGSRCGSWAVKNMKHCRKHLNDDEKVKLGLIVSNEEQTEGKSETKQATKPWNAEGNPWSLNLLKLQRKHPGFRCKWVNPDNILIRQDQGWKIANIKDYGGTTDIVAGEEGKLDTTIKRREMILMEIPEELARQRELFYHHKANAAMEAANKRAESSNEAADVRKAGHDPRITSRFSTQKGGF